MKPEIKVCSFEQSKRLCELGVSQELQPGDAYWATMSNGTNRCFFLSENEDPPPSMYRPIRAFDATEMGFMITRTANVRLPQWNEREKKFTISVYPDSPIEKTFSSTSEAIARADQLIWLIGSKSDPLLESVNNAIQELYLFQPQP
jgi:hypothetical protein